MPEGEKAAKSGLLPRACEDAGVAGGLISVEEARRRVLAAARPNVAERVPCADALGRVLAEDVASGEDQPPFDSSAMDGYAVPAGASGELAVVGEARAGAPAQRPVAPGEAIAISTGARVPEGAGAVVPIERVEPVPEPGAAGPAGRVRVPELPPGANIRRAGEDVKAGQTVLTAGTAVGPAEAAMLAALGRTEVACTRRTHVAIVVTGDELVEPGTPLGPGQIRDSNGPALAALATAAGARVTSRTRVGDDFAATQHALAHAIETADLVCVSGGVSVGEHDHVKPALNELGVNQSFWGVALKPGKPTWFGTAPGGELVFGLPGNPVSAMVTFQLFAHPALNALAGASEPLPPRVRARLTAPVALSEKREQAIRCRLAPADDGLTAEPTGAQGSHRISSMLGANALALVPQGSGELRAGCPVHVEPLPVGTFIP